METINKVFGGPLEWGYIDEKTGLWSPQGTKECNLVLYHASDILAKLVGGNADWAITTMYFEYTNGSVPSVTPTKSAGQSYYSGLVAPKDFVRSTIDTTPTYNSSDANYNSNIVRFFAATNGTVGHNGVAFSQTAGSKVYGGALVASPTGDFSGDEVFARFYFSSALSKLDGMQIGIKWGMLFTS